MIWTECERMQPPKDGTYMVTTANGAVVIDRFIDGEWGRCSPNQHRGRYKQHLAWGYMPKPWVKPKYR